MYTIIIFLLISQNYFCNCTELNNINSYDSFFYSVGNNMFNTTTVCLLAVLIMEITSIVLNRLLSLFQVDIVILDILHFYEYLNSIFLYITICIKYFIVVLYLYNSYTIFYNFTFNLSSNYRINSIMMDGFYKFPYVYLGIELWVFKIFKSI